MQLLSEFSADKRKKDGRRSTCRACNSALAREKWLRDRDKDVEARSAQRKSWYQRNREKVCAKMRLRTREYRREEKRKYMAKPENRAALLERSANNTHRRRAQQRDCVGLTAAQWREIVQRYDNRCAYCFVYGGLTRDHVVPLSRGGKHEPENVVPACGLCNSSKGNRLPSEWLARGGSNARAA